MDDNPFYEIKKKKRFYRPSLYQPQLSRAKLHPLLLPTPKSPAKPQPSQKDKIIQVTPCPGGCSYRGTCIDDDATTMSIL